MKRVIYMLILLAMPFAVMAQDVVKNKETGDKAYAEAKYAEAIAIYEDIIAEQGGTLPLFYNLGNSYYRNNQPGKAILNYERALKINPNDEDTKANLEFVQSKIVDRIPQDDVAFYKKWANSFYGMFAKDTWAIIGIVSFIIMLIALFFYYFKAETRKSSAIVVVVCLLFTIIANISAHNLNNSAGEVPEGVIMDEMVIVKSSPDNSGTELTKIHEGLKVKIIDNALSEWVKIEANNGNRVIGWIKAKSLEQI